MQQKPREEQITKQQFQEEQLWKQETLEGPLEKRKSQQERLAEQRCQEAHSAYQESEGGATLESTDLGSKAAAGRVPGNLGFATGSARRRRRSSRVLARRQGHRASVA